MKCIIYYILHIETESVHDIKKKWNVEKKCIPMYSSFPCINIIDKESLQHYCIKLIKSKF